MVGGEDEVSAAAIVSVDVGQEMAVVAGVTALLHSVDELPAVVLLLLALVQLRRRPTLLPFSRVGDFTSNTDVSLSMSDSTCNSLLVPQYCPVTIHITEQILQAFSILCFISI